MAFDAFLKIEGIDGESTDDAHAKWIEVLSYSHGVSQPVSGSVSSGGGRSAERCDHSDFSIVKSMDKATPKLNLYCSNGEHIPNLSLELCRAGGDKQKYMEYKLEDVIVTSVRPGGSSQGGENLPLEEVSFAYGKISWTYTETDHKTGKAAGNVSAYWDLHANKGG
jgi:type VI secretion system secreted protein Hcp